MKRLIRDCLAAVMLIALTIGAAGANQATGLWAATVVVDRVSETAGSDRAAPKPAAGEFSFRLLLHADGAQKINLLKQAVILWRPKKGAKEGEGSYVLVADSRVLEKLLANVEGTPQGQRFSTTNVEFSGSQKSMRGALAAGQTAWTEIKMPGNLSTHPYRHPFHPDHDNLDEFGKPLGAGREEVFSITRHIEFRFDIDPNNNSDPDVLTGTYRETLEGLHRFPIVVAGKIQLQRLTNIADIQQ